MEILEDIETWSKTLPKIKQCSLCAGFCRGLSIRAIQEGLVEMPSQTEAILKLASQLLLEYADLLEGKPNEPNESQSHTP